MRSLWPSEWQSQVIHKQQWCWTCGNPNSRCSMIRKNAYCVTQASMSQKKCDLIFWRNHMYSEAEENTVEARPAFRVVAINILRFMTSRWWLMKSTPVVFVSLSMEQRQIISALSVLLCILYSTYISLAGWLAVWRELLRLGPAPD